MLYKFSHVAIDIVDFSKALTVGTLPISIHKNNITQKGDIMEMFTLLLTLSFTFRTQCISASRLSVILIVF